MAVWGSHSRHYKTMLPRSSRNCSSQTCKNQEGMGHKLQQFAVHPQFVASKFNWIKMVSNTLNVRHLVSTFPISCEFQPCFILISRWTVTKIAVLVSRLAMDTLSILQIVPACSSAFAKTCVSLLTTEEAAAIAISTSRKYTDLQPCGNHKLMVAATMGASILKHNCLILSPYGAC